MTPVIPIVPIATTDPTYTVEQIWRESEVINALYEGKDKVTLVKADRVLKLPRKYAN